MKVTFNGNEVDAKTLAVDKMNDIAILKANIKPESIFPVSNDDVSLLEDVVVAGYPLGKRVSSAIKTHKGEEKGKFGRILGDIWCDGKSVNQLMCKVGHAVAYYGQNKDLIESAHLKNRKRVK